MYNERKRSPWNNQNWYFRKTKYTMKITVITVVYNNEKTIERCINSVIDQDYKNIEYIIIDGKSNDNTLSIIDRYKDKKDIIISENDEGIYDAMNKGYRLASGEIIGILNSDDYFYDSKSLSYIAEVFTVKNIDSCFGNLIYVDNAGDKVRNWKTGKFAIEKFKRAWVPPHPTFYIRKNIIDRYGLYDLSFNLAADYDFIFRLLYVNRISCEYIDKVLVKMTLGGVTNQNIKNIINQNIEIYKSWKKYSIKINFFNFLINKFVIRFFQRIRN